MKKNLLYLLVLLLIAIPVVAFAGIDFNLLIAGDCSNYWQTYSIVPAQPICSEQGVGQWSWGIQTEADVPPLIVVYGLTCQFAYQGQGNHILKSDYCGPNGEPGPKASGSTIQRVVALPNTQWYVLTIQDNKWWGTKTQTPLLGVKNRAVSFPGSPPNTFSTFCLSPNYASLSGCHLFNYEQFDLANLIR